jgi:hypothetical protein
MSTITLRNGIEVDDPLGPALKFLAAYSKPGEYGAPRPMTFEERDLRLANQWGARIAASEIAAILERRAAIESALRAIDPDASLADAMRSVPWIALTRLFDGFADIRGIGFSKMTKTLHRKRPALIPMLDRVVEAYLASAGPDRSAANSFGERATALVRSYKRDLDRNRSPLRMLQRELTQHGYRLSEVRILDVVIWSVVAQKR